MSLWVTAPGIALIVLALVVIIRWLILLQRRVNGFAERIARLEGKSDVPNG